MQESSKPSNFEKNAAPADLLQELQSEVTNEAAPLLQFLIKHAVTIMLLLGLFALSLGGVALYNWHAAKVLKQGQDSLAEVLLTKEGQDRLVALEKILAEVPSSMQLSVLMELGDTEMSLNHYDKAAQVYERVVAECKDESFATMAAVNRIEALYASGNNEKALSLINEIVEQKNAGQNPSLLNLQAEIALAAGKSDIAVKNYEVLIAKAQGNEKDYLEARLAALKNNQ